MLKNAKKSTTIIMLVVISLLWGLSYLIVKSVLEAGTPVFLLLTFRFTIGALSLLFIKKVIASTPKITPQEKYKGVYFAFIILIAFALQSFGARYTTPSKNAMLTGVYVILVAIIMVIVKRKFLFKPFIDALICVIGLYIFFEIFSEDINLNIGDFLSLGCALTFAIQFILLEKESPRLNALNFVMIQLFVVGAVSLVISLIFEIEYYSGIKITYLIFGTLFLGIVSTGFSYLVQTQAQATIKASTVSTILCSESVFAVAFSILFRFETVNIYILIGSIIIFGSILSSIFIKPIQFKRIRKPKFVKN